jgi:hypothetical protein
MRGTRNYTTRGRSAEGRSVSVRLFRLETKPQRYPDRTG